SVKIFCDWYWMRLAAIAVRRGLPLRPRNPEPEAMPRGQLLQFIRSKSTANGSSSEGRLLNMLALDHFQSFGYSTNPALTGLSCVYWIRCQSICSLHSRRLFGW